MALKRSLDATARRTVRRAITWRPKQAGDHQIDIRTLISPLRYDVQVRADFFGFLAGRAYDEPMDSLTAGALETGYATWFWNVAMPRFRPWVVASEKLAAEQFALRVGLARDLRRSFEEHGFQESSPVILRRTAPGQLSDTGARMQRTLHVGDGSHRLALLLQKGQPLEPWMYRIDPRPMPVLDNTVRVWPHRDVEDPTYLTFVGRGYLTDERLVDIGSAAELLERVHDEAGRSRAAELSGVMRAHAAAWGQVARLR